MRLGGEIGAQGVRLDPGVVRRLFVAYSSPSSPHKSEFAALMFAFAGRAQSFDSIRDVCGLSITSFHERCIHPPVPRLTSTLATPTAIEALIGLAKDGIFIAAFIRRARGN